MVVRGKIPAAQGADDRLRQSRVKDMSRDVLLTGNKIGLLFFCYDKLKIANSWRYFLFYLGNCFESWQNTKFAK